MKVYKIDRKHNFIEVEPEVLDDLWILNLVISESDMIGGKTTRRFRVEGSKDSEKKTVFVKLRLEKKDLDLTQSVLKLTGVIVSGSPEEYVDVNSHHSLDVTTGTKISIEKENLMTYEVDLLQNAKANLTLPKIYLLVLDDDSTMIAKVNTRSFEIIANISSGKAGKRLESAAYRNQYFSTIYSAMEPYSKDLIVVAGPGFEKDHFKDYVATKPDSKKYRFTHVNSTGITGLNELLKGGSISNILQEFRIQKDSDLINKIFTEIAKDGNVSYGYKDVMTCINENKVKELVITDSLLMSNYSEIRSVFSSLDANKINYHIIDKNTDAGKQLESLGGIAATLYYKN